MITIGHRDLETILARCGYNPSSRFYGIYVGPKYLIAACDDARFRSGKGIRYRHGGEFDGWAFLQRPLVEKVIAAGDPGTVIRGVDLHRGEIVAGGEVFPFYKNDERRPLPHIEFIPDSSDWNYSPVPGWNLSLCYVGDNTLYFTNDMRTVTGDDWNDAPYESNAGPPYEKFVSVKVMYSDPGMNLMTPDEGHYNSPYSIEMINAGQVPWLRFRRNVERCVRAGDNLKKVAAFLSHCEAEIYYPLSLVHLVQQQAFKP